MLTNSTVEQLPDGKAVIAVAGSLTLGTSLKLLDSQIQNLLAASEVRDLHFDLAEVDYVDSAGLGLLVHAYGQLNARQGTMRVTGVRPRIMELLKMTKLDTFLAVEPGAAPPPA